MERLIVQRTNFFTPLYSVCAAYSLLRLRTSQDVFCLVCGKGENRMRLCSSPSMTKKTCDHLWFSFDLFDCFASVSADGSSFYADTLRTVIPLVSIKSHFPTLRASSCYFMYSHSFTYHLHADNYQTAISNSTCLNILRTSSTPLPSLLLLFSTSAGVF